MLSKLALSKIKYTKSLLYNESLITSFSTAEQKEADPNLQNRKSSETPPPLKEKNEGRNINPDPENPTFRIKKYKF